MVRKGLIFCGKTRVKDQDYGKTGLRFDCGKKTGLELYHGKARVKIIIMVRQYLRLGLWQDKGRLGFNLNAIENWEENKNGVVKMQMKTNIDCIIL